MSEVGRLLYSLIILPLEYLIDALVCVLCRTYMLVPLVLLMLSWLINIFTLPLYLMAERMQKEERERQKAMEPMIRHIRKTFSGDERGMMLSKYYAVMKYKPASAVLGVVPLLLQIPAFIAAYHYLSAGTLLRGAGFLSITDLVYPDGMLGLGALKINVLPFVMSVIDPPSGAIYTRGGTLREKLQVFVPAGIFLILLYNSPSGLVLYWTFNNLFSLVRNLRAEFISNKKSFTLLVFALPPLHFIFHGTVVLGEQGWLAKHPFFFALLILPVLVYLFAIRKKSAAKDGGKPQAAHRLAMFIPLPALAAFFGIVIPLSVIQASPQEFISATGGGDPLR